MENENDTGTGTVEADASVLLENGEPVAAIVSLPESGEENDSEINGDESGGEISDAVAIAAIDADKEVAIATIHADVETARIEAEEERVETWQEKLAELQGNILELTNRLETIAANLSPVEADPLTPTPPLELAAEVAEEVASLSTPQSTLDPTSSIVTEVELESEEGKQEAEATVTVRKKRRLI